MSVPPSPRWVPDSDRLSCCGCQVKFSWLVRRHHCRVCGEVYCDVCTRRRAYVGADNLVRVCDSCHSSFRKAKMSVTSPSIVLQTVPVSKQRDKQNNSFGIATGVLLVCAVACAALDFSFVPEESSIFVWPCALCVVVVSVSAVYAFRYFQKWKSGSSETSSSGLISASSSSAAVKQALETGASESNVHEAARTAIQKAKDSALSFALEGWNPPQSVHGAFLARKKVEGAPLDPIQIEGLVRGVTPQVFCRLFQHADFKKFTQPDTKYSQCIERIDDIDVMIEETNLPCPLANRDTVFVTTSVPYKDGMMMIEADFDHPLRPPLSSPVRARVSSVHLMTVEPGMDKVVRLKMNSIFDPKGNIPLSLVNSMIADNCKVFTKMNAFIASVRGQELIAEFSSTLKT